ncbi:MAG TPA: YbhB/YbcL family Raf kinase inhibitor-like protein [Anaerolineae bacterium]|nr:YbhB/YbcL family Raf kinase inhibitor-like protein [Anaerolineae bacterium]
MRLLRFFSIAVLLSACSPAPEPGSTAPSFQLDTSAFTDGATVPDRYSCQGDDVSPELNWQTPPAEVKSFALIMDDPDAPGGTFTHWVLFNLPPTTRKLPEGGGAIGVAGQNGFGADGYRGPCPPIGGGVHRYFFKVYALDVAALNLPAGASRNDVEQALRDHVSGRAQLMGRFER